MQVIKTYAIRGLSEWYGTLKAGSLSVDGFLLFFDGIYNK